MQENIIPVRQSIVEQSVTTATLLQCFLLFLARETRCGAARLCSLADGGLRLRLMDEVARVRRGGLSLLHVLSHLMRVVVLRAVSEEAIDGALRRIEQR